MNEIRIPNKKINTENSYKIFSVRIPTKLYEKLSELTSQTELSRNEIITILLNEAIEIAVVTDVNK
ncbi:MAG: ribbon-helix-helix protein, CopG family [Clostridia bacterium]